MTTLEQIQQEIQTLPEATLDLLAQFIQLLKKSQAVSQSHLATPKPSPGPDVADWSDFIGSIEAEEDLSVNYKTYLAEGLEQKYDHR